MPRYTVISHWSDTQAAFLTFDVEAEKFWFNGENYVFVDEDGTHVAVVDRHVIAVVDDDAFADDEDDDL